MGVAYVRGMADTPLRELKMKLVKTERELQQCRDRCARLQQHIRIVTLRLQQALDGL